MKTRLLILGLLCIFGAQTAWAVRVPWRKRIGQNVEAAHITVHKNTPIDLWPEEPPSPSVIDKEKFTQGLARLCGAIGPGRAKKYANLILQEAGNFEVDPFLLAGLVYDQSGCYPTTYKRDRRRGRYGLTRIPVVMHARQMKKDGYHYFVKEADEWQEKIQKLDRYPFNKWKAAVPKSNLYFAAAFLSIFKKQAKSLKDTFNSVPHRHYVSHWFYGDKVRQVEPEDRVLIARRRLLQYYEQKSPEKVGHFDGVDLYMPVDGAPRLVMDYFGNKRKKKKSRGHKGIDIDGKIGEPILAIAKGRVTFAGVDLPGGGANKKLTPKEAAEFPKENMGPGGLFVHIRHNSNFGTLYMHLDELKVNYFDEVVPGQIIGTLGKSGTKTSGPHLHLEFREKTHRINPATYLKKGLVNPHTKKKKPTAI